MCRQKGFGSESISLENELTLVFDKQQVVSIMLWKADVFMWPLHPRYKHDILLPPSITDQLLRNNEKAEQNYICWWKYEQYEVIILQLAKL